MARRLENAFLAGVSVKIGRSKGRQAPTIPSDDSTMGQYTVGVRASSHLLSKVLIEQGEYGYVHVISSSPIEASGKCGLSMVT